MITTINEFKKQQEYNIKLDRKTIFSYIEWQGNCKDLYPGYSNPEDVSDITDEYYFETKKKAYQYADEVINLFTSLPNPIPIYRCIKAKDIEHIDLEMHGESWSFEKQSALDFGSRNGSNFLLSTFVNKQDVNWQGTIKAYTIFSGGYSDEDENEIVVDGFLKDITITKLKDKKLNEFNSINIDFNKAIKIFTDITDYNPMILLGDCWFIGLINYYLYKPYFPDLKIIMVENSHIYIRINNKYLDGTGYYDNLEDTYNKNNRLSNNKIIKEWDNVNDYISFLKNKITYKNDIKKLNKILRFKNIIKI